MSCTRIHRTTITGSNLAKQANAPSLERVRVVVDELDAARPQRRFPRAAPALAARAPAAEVAFPQQHVDQLRRVGREHRRNDLVLCALHIELEDDEIFLRERSEQPIDDVHLHRGEGLLGSGGVPALHAERII
eukprot:CAMPEP_0119363816 /NCGR_PEP_ID=MMETSP1334-20130426/10737_1 /TAXON_ID=127549 /ORGANISM="Calcidiscus leptoporus, Strain RCC1130" /LENGTH=132 /DNA_ID=CAMNT_0007379363 /DNA_START=147 /DNA_END=546 /DNA_ORIENTATION=-